MSAVPQSIRVSASRLKTLNECTLRFYYQEILRLPSAPHHKTLQGSTTHEVFETLFNPRRAALLKSILLSGRFLIEEHPSLSRLIRAKLHHYKIADRATVADIAELLRVAFLGIRPYFVSAEGVWSPPLHWFSEKRFQMTLSSGAVISGFIDLLLVWADRIVVVDLKSQGQKFVQASLPHNLQAVIYQFAVFKEYGLVPTVDFVMLRHAPTARTPLKHIQRVDPPCIRVLSGLESYIEFAHGAVNRFGLQEAMSAPCSDEGFCFRVCPYYKPFTYWEVIDPDLPTGSPAKSSHLDLDEAWAVCAGSGMKVVEKAHKGCFARWSEPTQ